MALKLVTVSILPLHQEAGRSSGIKIVHGINLKIYSK